MALENASEKEMIALKSIRKELNEKENRTEEEEAQLKILNLMI
jgi:hypothetical protein